MTTENCPVCTSPSPVDLGEFYHCQECNYRWWHEPEDLDVTEAHKEVSLVDQLRETGECSHCWHSENFMLMSYPPKTVETCCYCGKQKMTTEKVFQSLHGHGQFAPKSIGEVSAVIYEPFWNADVTEARPE